MTTQRVFMATVSESVPSMAWAKSSAVARRVDMGRHAKSGPAKSL